MVHVCVTVCVHACSAAGADPRRVWVFWLLNDWDYVPTGNACTPNVLFFTTIAGPSASALPPGTGRAAMPVSHIPAVHAAGGGSWPCKDRHHNCTLLAQKGQCARRPRHMLRHCKVACKVCPPTPARQAGCNVFPIPYAPGMANVKPKHLRAKEHAGRRALRKTYTYHRGPATWEGADALCRGLNQTLASICNDVEQKAAVAAHRGSVHRAAPNPSPSQAAREASSSVHDQTLGTPKNGGDPAQALFWIGLTGVSRDAHSGQWADGSTCAFRNWERDEPTNDCGNEPHTLVDVSSAS